MKRDLISEIKMMTDWPVPIIDATACNGCGLCVQVCPQKVLIIRDRLAMVNQPDACVYTGHCAQICPQTAVYLAFCIVTKIAGTAEPPDSPHHPRLPSNSQS